MIAASEPQEFVPSGRQQALKHPGPPLATYKKLGEQAEDLLLDKFEQVSLKEKKENEWWILRKAPVLPTPQSWPVDETEDDTFNKSVSHYNLCKSGALEDSNFSYKSAETSHRKSKRWSGNVSKISNKPVSEIPQIKCDELFSAKNQVAYMEDELYVRGNTAIWTRGLLNNCDNSDNGRKTMCAYTSPLPIKHAIWCTFHLEHSSYETDLFPIANSKNAGSVAIPAVCIVDAHNIHVFTQKGEDFVSAIPFKIAKLWNTQFGLFLEKESESHNIFFENKSSLYSLAFTLDEVCPVAINTESHLQLLNNNNLKIVYTNENPSICMMYDQNNKQHSVYIIRKIKKNEKNDLAIKFNITNPSSVNISNKTKSRNSVWDSLKTNFLPVPSPMNSRPGSVTSFHNVQSRSHSSMATMSRCQSPAPSSVGSPWLQRASRLNASIQCRGNNCVPSNCSFFDSSKVMTYLDNNPNICLEHIWTESVSISDDNSLATSKVFLCDDLIGRWYLSYINSYKLQLCLVQINFKDPLNITMGASNNISAKDAVPIPALHMLAILEHNGNVTLYSGLTPVGKLHIGGTLVQHTPSPYIRRQFNSPFPRRSSLLPHSKPIDPKFDEHLLSPVLPESSNFPPRLHLNFQIEGNLPNAVLNNLRDPIENRITLRYSDGTFYRITFPPLTCHPLVDSCIAALRQSLSADTVLILLNRWYANRNALGAQDMNLEDEWNLFQTLLFELLGYEQVDHVSEDCPVTPSSNPKRQKHSICGSDDDWLFMVNSNHGTKISTYLQQQLHLPLNRSRPDNSDFNSVRFNPNSVLFPHLKLILYTLHLLYEDLKLNVMRHDDLKLLAKFLNQLSRDLDLTTYSVHYWLDFPEICKIHSTGHLMGKCTAEFTPIKGKPPSIMSFILNLIQGDGDFTPYPFLKYVNTRSRDIIEICATIYQLKHKIDNLIKPALLETPIDVGMGMEMENGETSYTTAEQVLLLMLEKKITVRDLDTLPPAIYLLLYNSLWQCRQNPPPDLPAEAYYLIWRDDLAAQALKIDKNKVIIEKSEQMQDVVPSSTQLEAEQLDGMEDIESQLLKLRFPDDVRVNEVRKMLQSSKPVPIVLVQRPDVSDHDFIEEQEKHLYAICTRTMALSTGRGMFTLRTSTPVITEPLQTPQLCLAGKAPPRGTTVELNHIDTPSNMNLWPLFHNGVANGLRITPDAHNIDNTWIIFNKPKSSVEQQMEHAGFLMALGLNGHLKNLDVLNTYDYLSKLHEMTSIGILLGLSAAFRGTSHMGMTKTLSIHVEALLPPTSMELDVHQNVQVAALLGIGLVYQGSSHRHIIEVLLSEIGRPPGPEMENSVDRESYSLAAGLSLGLVTLKQGCSLGLSDLNVPDRLHYYMVGGNRRPLTGAQKDKYKVPSFQIREGSSVNLDVTAPGATIALGLMYLGSGNKAVADWMAPPETQYLLDFVRPDFLMLRILARSLILWDEIEPRREWVEMQVPDTIRPYCMIKPTPNSDIDYEAMNQAYCNIVTGACLALGLKYAGSADEEAFKTLLHFSHLFTNLTIKSIAELAGKPTVETCLNVLLLSTSMVMAGTGNLEIIRLVRLLRRRVGVASTAVVTYGSHLALHMALGLLFLGGGRYTLSNSPENIAALICAFYPKFPTHSNDNRYHLQAFRHLYVLAVEPRLIIPKDVHSGKISYANLRVVKIDNTTLTIKGPGIIPDLNILQKVYVDDDRYWPVVFQRGRNWDILIKILATTGYIDVKQRAGCLSYVADKLGYYSQLAKLLTQSELIPWDPSPSSIVYFAHDQSIKFFCDHFLISEERNLSKNELEIVQMLTKITYDAVVKDKLIVVPVFTFLVKMVKQLKILPSAMNFWQLKLILAQILTRSVINNLISAETILAVEQQVTGVLEEWESALSQALHCYLNGLELNFDRELLNKLAMFVIFYDIPFKSDYLSGDFLELIHNFPTKISCKTASKIANNCALNK